MATRQAPPGFPQPQAPLRNDPSKNRSAWSVFPDQLPTTRFNGFQNRDNESLLRGSFVLGQNVVFGGEFQPTIRQGFEAIGSQATDSNGIQRAWVYETRDGLVYDMKQDTAGKIWYWLRDVSTDWATLLTGLTASTRWDFANIGKTSEDTNHVLFSNGVDDFYRFNGATTTVASVTTNTITKQQGAATWRLDDFYSVGTRGVRINGVTYTYTGGEGTATLTGVTPDPTGLMVAGDLVVQAAQVVASLASFKSNVLMAHDGRLHLVMYAKPTQWAYSKLDDPYDFTTGSSDGDGGLKEIELGGPIVAFGKLNRMALAFKNRLVKSLTFQQFGTRLDSPFYQTLTTTDDKSTTLGTLSNRTICSTPKGLVFVTPDKRLVLLTGVTANNEPQYIVLSDPIQPVFDVGVFDTTAMVCADNVVWLAFQSESGIDTNETVIRSDLTRQTIMPDGKVIPCMWDLPIVGWQVGDWTVVYNPDTGKNEAHWHSSLNSGSYKIIANPTDAGTPFTTTVRTWAETFGAPHLQKRIDQFFIEVKMSANTNLLLSLLYNENGVTQVTEFTLDGDATSNKFNVNIYNPFGASAFGSKKFGSNESIDENPTYRFYIKTNRIPPFHNISMQLSSDEDGQSWKLIRFGYRLAEILPEPDNYLLLR